MTLELTVALAHLVRQKAPAKDEQRRVHAGKSPLLGAPLLSRPQITGCDTDAVYRIAFRSVNVTINIIGSNGDVSKPIRS